MSDTKLPPLTATRTSPNLGKAVNLYQSKYTENGLFNDGRSYVIGSSSVPHQLPAPANLRPYIDRVSGEMESWPAGNGGRKVHGDIQLATKPRLLQKLETYLQKELRVLDCSDTSVASEKRLQPFREVFGFIIENFRTYKPILSSIKHEYEAMLSSQKDAIQDLEPLKAMVVNINERCEQKILNIKQEEKQELTQLKAENAGLRNTIAELNEEIVSLQQQVKKCQTEIGIEYQKYRDEMDARKILIQDINDMKYQQEEFKKTNVGPSDTNESDKEDSVILRIALSKAREELESKSRRLIEVLADYGDVIPRREFENMEKQFQAMTEEFEELEKNHNNLMKEHSTLIDIHKEAIETRDNFAFDCERMRQSATPRPDWSKCGLYVEGGPDRWIEITSEKSTSDKVDILISELTGQDLSAIKTGVGMVDYFEPKGTESSVPTYLHATERIRNRRLNKRDLMIMIKDIWSQKMSEEGGKPFTPHSKMADYLKKFLQTRFSVEALVIEWGYNIHDALIRYSFDKTVAAFSAILNEEIDEDTHYAHLCQLEDLFKAFAAVDEADSGVLSIEQFENSAKAHFNWLTNENILQMVQAADEELNGFTDNMVSYRDLFTEDDEGQNGPFVLCVRSLHEGDKNTMINEIESQLDKKSEVTIDDFKEVLFNVAPKLFDSEYVVQQVVNLAFRSEEQSGTIDRTSLIDNLKASCIART